MGNSADSKSTVGNEKHTATGGLDRRSEKEGQTASAGHYEATCTETFAGNRHSENEGCITGVGPVPLKLIASIESALCKLTITKSGKTWNGSGFLVTLPVRVYDNVKQVRGLLTNNHVIDEDCLANDLSFTAQFQSLKEEKVIRRELIRYKFTCSRLDATFVEFTDDMLSQLEKDKAVFLLHQASTLTVNTSVFILQHPLGGEAAISIGMVKS